MTGRYEKLLQKAPPACDKWKNKRERERERERREGNGWYKKKWPPAFDFYVAFSVTFTLIPFRWQLIQLWKHSENDKRETEEENLLNQNRKN